MLTPSQLLMRHEGFISSFHKKQGGTFVEYYRGSNTKRLYTYNEMQFAIHTNREKTLKKIQSFYLKNSGATVDISEIKERQPDKLFVFKEFPKKTEHLFSFHLIIDGENVNCSGSFNTRAKLTIKNILRRVYKELLSFEIDYLFNFKEQVDESWFKATSMRRFVGRDNAMLQITYMGSHTPAELTGGEY